MLTFGFNAQYATGVNHRRRRNRLLVQFYLSHAAPLTGSFGRCQSINEDLIAPA